MKFKLELLSENKYRILTDNNTYAIVYNNPYLTKYLEEGALQQLLDAAKLPGVISPVIGMPDIHFGFGLPIGGVMAVDGKEGVISSGGVGMDINCGVRLLRTNINAKELDKKLLRRILDTIERLVPTGVGKKSRHNGLSKNIDEILLQGVKSLIKKGYGWEGDLLSIEENGSMAGGNISSIPIAALKENQLSTVGGGNHFIELGLVDKVFDENTADTFGLEKGKLTVMIHTGSRRLGHDTCTHYSKVMAEKAEKYGIKLPNKGLAACPIHSKEGQEYYGAMACAVNYAFSNRQLITHDVREAFVEVFNKPINDLGLELVYDVAHNIAKFEDYDNRKILIHRKGATRALAPGHRGNPLKYLNTGHPVLIPGSMGSYSYVLTGTQKARETFYSVNHGAGRVMSRNEARKTISKEQFDNAMGSVLYNSRNYSKLLDEAPTAYKDINEVIDTLADIKITNKVVRLRPLAVIKGEGD